MQGRAVKVRPCRFQAVALQAAAQGRPADGSAVAPVGQKWGTGRGKFGAALPVKPSAGAGFGDLVGQVGQFSEEKKSSGSWWGLLGGCKPYYLILLFFFFF